MEPNGSSSGGRREGFRALSAHIWYKRLVSRLSRIELAACENFIEANDHLSKNEFESRVNRWFLDDVNKPVRWSIMQECVAAVNGLANKKK